MSDDRKKDGGKGDLQVGGHGGSSLIFEDGKVIKRANYPKELAFYQAIESGQAKAVKQHGLAPKFFGTVKRPFEGQEVEYFVMEDVCAGFVKPCVLDIKMGTRTWHSECDQKKREEHMDQDYSCTTHKYGFRFAGMKTYDPATGEVKKWPRKFAWDALDDQKMLAAWGEFLSCMPTPQLKEAALRKWSERVLQVGEFFRAEGGWDIVASSLLFAYDADPKSTKEPIVYMIDFAHATKLPPKSFDGGYYLGCRELARFFNLIINPPPPPPAPAPAAAPEAPAQPVTTAPAPAPEQAKK